MVLFFPIIFYLPYFISLNSNLYDFVFLSLGIVPASSDPNLFQINATTGELTVTQVLDYEETPSYRLTVKVGRVECDI